MSHPFHLDNKLLTLTGNDSSMSWTIRNAVEGVQIFGGIGSGKTTGSGRTLALKYLSAGFGGLVLTVKPEEKTLWQDYCKITGRENDLIILSPDEAHRFNFLSYISQVTEGRKSPTENIVQVLKTVIRANEQKASGKSDDPFWETALDMLIANIIDLCLLAYGKVTVQDMHDIAQVLPQKSDNLPDLDKDYNIHDLNAFNKAYFLAGKSINEQGSDYVSLLSEEDKELFEHTSDKRQFVGEAVPEVRTFLLVEQFFAERFGGLSEKTRSIIDFSFSGFLHGLMREPVYSLFCNGDSTFKPEDCRAGKIILIDLPVKNHFKVGRDSQILFKYIWQRAMESSIGKGERPVFLWADEAQNFLHEYDAEYQATARSSRIATVYLSQNLPNYYANMGGAKSEFLVKSFLGTLATKIFHANADVETNRYASELIGDIQYKETSQGTTTSDNFSFSSTSSLKIDKALRPEEFSKLKTGGPANDSKVEGYLHLQSNSFKNANYTRLTFDQNFIPHT